jgi:hypothetical protein
MTDEGTEIERIEGMEGDLMTEKGRKTNLAFLPFSVRCDGGYWRFVYPPMRRRR